MSGSNFLDSLLNAGKELFNAFRSDTPISEPFPPGQPNSIPHGESNEHYTALRAQARQEGEQMVHCFQQSREAYSSGNGAGAKQLSNQGKEHEQNMKRLNHQASEWIFNENNKNRQSDEVDLHGLFVAEAVEYSDKAIIRARQAKLAEIRLIVGKGLHSPNGVAKVKPAIEQLMQKHQLVAALDPHNEGVLLVYLDPRKRGDATPGTIIGLDDLLRRLQDARESCILM